MNEPERVVVEHSDGTRHDAPFGALSVQARLELSALGLCDPPAPDREMGYLLLEWKDGWKEVVAVAEGAVELLRYYTIERTEEVGRLSLDTTEAYPQLFLIKRLPGDVRNILFVRKEGLQAYVLQEKATVKEGGKVEHVYYDKKRPNLGIEDPSAASARYAVVLDSLKMELQNKGMSASRILSKSTEERAALYEQLARATGLRGAERQRDLYGFLDLALERMEPEG